MKRNIILFGFIAILSSCNNSRIGELEAENMELRVTVERLTQELDDLQQQAEEAKMMAMEAQKIAKEQAAKAAEAANK